MIEVFLFGIILGLIPSTLTGLFVTTYLQYRRGDQLTSFYFFFFFLLTSNKLKKARRRLNSNFCSILSDSFGIILT
ncbi:hypothetical protein UlMin_000206 [Ulmus minor]